MGAGGQREPLSARRSPADGGLPDAELARPAHQSGEARLLARAQRARRSTFRRRRRMCRSCRRRGGPRRADAGADARASSRGPELCVVPRDVRLLRPGIRRVWAGRRTARSRSRREARGDDDRVSRTASQRVGSVRCSRYVRKDRQAGLPRQPLAPAAVAMRSGGRAAVGRTAHRRHAQQTWRRTDIGSAAWSKRL